MNELHEYDKVTSGFVSQSYKKNKDGKFVCIDQDFICGDDVSREDTIGDSLPPDQMGDAIQNEIDLPIDLVRPGLDHYVLQLEGCIDPSLIGPYETYDAAQIVKEKLVDNPNNDHNSYIVITVTAGAKIRL